MSFMDFYDKFLGILLKLFGLTEAIRKFKQYWRKEKDSSRNTQSPDESQNDN